MSILIKGIEMPKEPWECPCHDEETGRCNVTQKVCFEIPKDCPLSSAHSERPKGHWIFVHPLQEDDGGAYMCSECRTGNWEIDPERYFFCPYCGADMIGDTE